MEKSIAIVSLLLLFGCATHREFGRPIDPVALADLKPGISTMDDVRTKFGKPFSVSQDSEGKTMWTYAYSKFDSHRAPLPFAKGDYTMSHKSVVIGFDGAGKFERYVLNRSGDEDLDQMREINNK